MHLFTFLNFVNTKSLIARTRSLLSIRFYFTNEWEMWATVTIEVLALKFATIRYTLHELAQLSSPPIGIFELAYTCIPRKKYKIKTWEVYSFEFLNPTYWFFFLQNHIGRCYLTCEQERTTDLFLPILNLLTIFIIIKKPYIDLLRLNRCIFYLIAMMLNPISTMTFSKYSLTWYRRQM